MLNLFVLTSLEAMMLPVKKPQPLGRLIKIRNYLCTMLCLNLSEILSRNGVEAANSVCVLHKYKHELAMGSKVSFSLNYTFQGSSS